MGSTLPTGWSRKRLDEIAYFLDGQRKPIKEGDRQSIQGPYPYYGASGIIDYVNAYLFDDELILLGEDGANIVNRSTPLAFRVSGKCWVNNHAHVIKPRDCTEIDFLVEYLESLDYGGLNSGTAQPKLNLAACQSIPVLVPPTEEQKAIGAVLSTWNRGIRQLTDLLATKVRFKQGLMQQLLTGKRRFPEFAQGEWAHRPIGSFLTESRIPGSHGGKAKKITVKLYGKGVVRKSETRAGSAATKYYKRQVGQFIYSKLDFLNGAFGIIPEKLDGYESTLDLPAFDIGDSVDPSWFRYFVIREKFYKNLIGLANGGRKARRVNPDDLLQVRIPFPPKMEQTRIAQVLQTLDQEIALLRKQLDALKQQKKGLMQKLLTGEVRVKIPH